MKITYIYNSCYLIEYDNYSLLFDFYQDVEKEPGVQWINDYLLSKPQDLYVFVSHSHHDHFNPEILTWKENKANIHYIFSHELIDAGVLEPSEDIRFLDRGEAWSDDNIHVQAFGSTDTGGSFLLTIDGKKLFHAGDLNNWHWCGQVSRMETAAAENHFLCELELVTEALHTLHVAMFPIDPRLGDDYMRGARQFVRRIATDYFLPMHFGDSYDKANAFEKDAQSQTCTYLPVHRKGESYEIIGESYKNA